MHVPLWIIIFLILVGVAGVVTIIASIVWKYEEVQHNRRRPTSSPTPPQLSSSEMSAPTNKGNPAPSSSFDGPQGLGGWLIWFQIRIYLGIASTLGSAGSVSSAEAASPKRLLVFAAVILLIVCLVFFYQRKLKFRIPYIVADVLSLFYLVLIYGKESYLFGILLIEGGIIYALFRSKRVANTFH